MIQHLEGFHLLELSDQGFKNLCRYSVHKGFIAQQLLPEFTDKNFRIKAAQAAQGKLLLTIGQLLEFIDERVPRGPYDIKRNGERTAWKFNHEEKELNSSEPIELISTLWNIAKLYFEEGKKIQPLR